IPSSGPQADNVGTCWGNPRLDATLERFLQPIRASPYSDTDPLFAGEWRTTSKTALYQIVSVRTNADQCIRGLFAVLLRGDGNGLFDKRAVDSGRFRHVGCGKLARRRTGDRL